MPILSCFLAARYAITSQSMMNLMGVAKIMLTCLLLPNGNLQCVLEIDVSPTAFDVG